MSDDRGDIVRRKRDHLEVAASGAADFAERTTLLEDVALVHQALAEIAVDELDLTTELCGLKLAAPVVITGMTGGTPEARAINRDLAVAAARAGVAMGVGSQRAMAEHPELEDTFQVKDAAPSLVLFGNIGVVQARALGHERIAELAKRIGADAMAVHLNPAQEMIQERGDRDFRGATDTIARLVETLPCPVIVKETGCGLSLQAARRLAYVGVKTVDVAGAGGTSWVAVEARRAAEGSPARELGTELWDWGLPTAVSVVACASAGLEVIASGGLRSGHDVARALALGGHAGAVGELLGRVIHSIRTTMLLCGARRPADLQAAPRHIAPALRGWLDDLGLPAPGLTPRP